MIRKIGFDEACGHSEILDRQIEMILGVFFNALGDLLFSFCGKVLFQRHTIGQKR